MEPSLYVPKNYEMDPKFETIVDSTALLKSGMVVLINDFYMRENLTTEYEPGRVIRADESNRWCTITYISEIIRDYITKGSHVVRFVGLYGDGSKKNRLYNISHSWIVKIDSIPKESSEPDIIDRLCQMYGIEATLENVRRILSSQDGRDVLNGL
jgi:hypothetical protein